MPLTAARLHLKIFLFHSSCLYLWQSMHLWQKCSCNLGTHAFRQITCQRNAHFHFITYSRRPDLERIFSSSIFLNARNTDRGASNRTMADREKIRVRSLIE